MPRGDRTGPDGMGPMTGRRAGFCAGFDAPGYANPIPGRGFGGRGRGQGRGGGGGRGWRHRFYATGTPGWQQTGYAQPYPYPYPYLTEPTTLQPNKEGELEALKEQLKYQEELMSGLQKRIVELEGPSEK